MQPDQTLSSANPEFRQYLALLTQIGTEPPTATILKNTLGATPLWTRVADGVYVITLTGAFPETKTAIMLGDGTANGDGRLIYIWTSTNTIELNTFLSGTLDDDLMQGATIQILVKS